MATCGDLRPLLWDQRSSRPCLDAGEQSKRRPNEAMPQGERGRRSAAIPPNQLSQGNVGKMWQLWRFPSYFKLPSHYEQLPYMPRYLGLLHKPLISYTTPHHTTPHHTTPHHTTPHYTTLHSTPLHSTPLHSTKLHYTTLHYTTQCYTILYYTILYYTTLCYTILYCTILYYAVLYYTILYYYAILLLLLCYAMPYYALLC